MMTISALTPTTTPTIAITLISDSSFDPRRLRRYRHAIASSSEFIPVASSETESRRGCSACPVRYMNSRSIPMPTPPIGGMPYSIARR